MREGTIDFEGSAILDFELNKPQLKQVAHHLILIDFFIHCLRMKNKISEHRLNLYAAIYTIEIDMGTETSEQLKQKFRMYYQEITYLNS
ncbi:hypothetical protein COK05_15995 [Bacillus cereus]|uniref:Uncharacterized protein n=1 Tax=Bacillus cereus TaxID=1396 RepID=A0A2B2LQS0_BACCE|nr:hypothetical protein [Bacillus cereus]PFQ44836.1 hypothetical protein COK05_15995 [Bacillus cereus]